MKILQVVHSFPDKNTAGTEIYTYNLSKELLKNNEVSIFYRISELKKKEYDFVSNKLNGLNIFTINNTFRFCDSFEKFYKNDVIARNFAELLDEIKPDLVHIQHLIFLSVTIIEEIKKRKIPIVFTLHDYWLICPQWHFLKKDLGICDNNDTTQCINCLDYQLSIKELPKKFYLTFRNRAPDFAMRFLKNMYLNLAKINLDSSNMLEKINARRALIKELCLQVDVFIAPSQFLRRKFIEFGIPENKIEFISHGINKESFTGSQRKTPDVIRFSFIGTILPAKGVDVLIKAFNRIRDGQAELKIYGSLSPYKGFERYPSRIKRLAINKNIQFMGQFDYNKISEAFLRTDVLVVPSIWNENCPLVILEAFSNKIPVIASRIGGIPELVADGINGILFQSGNAEDLYQKMQLLISEPAIINKLKGNIPEIKSICDNAKEIESIYSNLLTAKNCLV